MAKWKPAPPRTDAVIRAGREAKSYRVSLDVEKRFLRGMRRYSALPLLLGLVTAYGVHLVFFTFILPLLVSWIQGLGNYPNFYLAAIYGLGLPIFLIGGQFLAYRFGDRLVAGLTPLDEGLSLLQQRAERLRHRGKRYLLGLLVVAGGSIYLGTTDSLKAWFLLTLVCAALVIERFVMPARFPLPDLSSTEVSSPEAGPLDQE